MNVRLGRTAETGVPVHVASPVLCRPKSTGELRSPLGLSIFLAEGLQQSQSNWRSCKAGLWLAGFGSPGKWPNATGELRSPLEIGVFSVRLFWAVA